mmetsp:Transcript_15176/g.32690  ORF Transcript_15176/g.32690 Transcript_15176/m.32690 type:complete len:155 (-) Transcript_15176:279-743(-)
MSKAWYESNRTAGAYYSEEGVECVKGVGKKAEGLKSHGIKTVGDLWVVVDDVVKRVNTINLVPPLPTNHLDNSNHWESRYGNWWREEIDKSSLMSHYTSICSLVHHIIREGKHIFGGIEREDNWSSTTMLNHDKWMEPVLNITPDSRQFSLVTP